MMDAAGTVNNQIADAVAQANTALRGMQVPFATGAACHAITHALSLALHNAVLRQQHSHMLRNALTTAAATAMLDGRIEQAEAVMKLAESPLANPSLNAEVDQLLASVKTLQAAIHNVLQSAEAAPEPSESPQG